MQASLKNWGHDFLKSDDTVTGVGGKTDDTPGGTKERDKDRIENHVEGGENLDSSLNETGGDKNGDEKEDRAGTKRKPADTEEKRSKKRETRKGSEGGKSDEHGDLSKGDTVNWKWGTGHPHGKVLDVKEETCVSPAQRVDCTRLMSLLSWYKDKCHVEE